jgi:hypothetical protein
MLPLKSLELVSKTLLKEGGNPAALPLIAFLLAASHGMERENFI